MWEEGNYWKPSAAYKDRKKLMLMLKRIRLVNNINQRVIMKKLRWVMNIYQRKVREVEIIIEVECKKVEIINEAAVEEVRTIKIQM